MRAPAIRAAALRRLLRPGFLLLGAVLLAGCAAAATGGSAADEPDDRTVRTHAAGAGRTAVVVHPPTAGPGAPLVVVLHGAGGSAADARAHLGWDALGERDGFVVAYPDGVDGTWNAGSCCGRARDLGVDDAAYLHELREQLIAEDAVDAGRVYAVGFSNGAMMSYRWACGRPGDLAGIGSVAGTLLVDCPEPAPLTVAAVQGTADDRVPIGGRPQRGFPPLDATLAPFLAAAGCAGDPTVIVEAQATVSTWGCAAGRTVTRDVIDGAPHEWPGAGRDDTGTSDDPLDATGFLWARLRSASGA
ncbi:alpha/beta hydrolase family esterase [Pseudonocardia bannensis]|uniref:Polyhydroxybutyrate depolymerase n=1 Tax=Pseudonocardia bannensis TaxID=630973 RepID=A0A848DPB6_9PSEU|nr:PHB depolymerase family esterase [Pseudonocardia bannensis]NMH94375.1 polyhydroxybutyrate depolymerase [Pseudonocardia bannensis]